MVRKYGKITIPKREVDIIREVDVLIAGGGPAGFAAALSASRQGMKTLILERFNCLGGTATAGLVGPFMPTAGENGGIYKEFLGKLKEIGGAIGKSFDVEAFKYIAQEMCEESKVESLLNNFICDVVMEENYIKAIIIANKSGLQAVSAKIIIDATGDGDVSFFAGAEYEKGDKNGKCQPTNMMFQIGGINESKALAAEEIVSKVELARNKKEVNLPYYVDYIWGDKGSTIRKGEISINRDMTEGIDGTNPEALTNAEIEGRKLVWECVKFIQKYISGGEKAYLLKTPFLYGIRETRRILGEYFLTEDDVLKATKFKDGIAKGSFFIDIHGPHLRDKNWVKSHSIPEGKWYEIPYRCLVPRKIENLLTAGRCISSDREANGSLRIMPICIATGQAAGIASALAVKEKVRPRKISGEKIREILISQGADL